MLRARISERLLALVTPRERAAAIVGDLLELHPGDVAFSFAVIRTLWTLSWRYGLAFLAAVAAEFCCFYVVINWAGHTPHGMDLISDYSTMCFLAVGPAAAFSGIRFGLFAPISRLSGALMILSGLDMCFWWAPFVRPIAAAMGLLVLLLCCVTREGRIALGRLLVAAIASFVPYYWLMRLSDRWTAAEYIRRCPHGCSQPIDLALYDPGVILILIAFFLSGGILAAVLGRRRERPALLS